MNLYAITPCHAPHEGHGVTFTLCGTDEEALKRAVYHAAYDAVKEYGSPRAEVYRIATDVQYVGEAHATDAPQEWTWAHPGVEENAALHACSDAEAELGECICGHRAWAHGDNSGFPMTSDPCHAPDCPCPAYRPGDVEGDPRD